jgi:alanyl aminopeptidase
VSIDLELKEATAVIWLHSTELRISRAVLARNGESRTATVIEGGKELAGFSFAEPVPPGPATLQIEYSGPIQSSNATGVFKQTENGKLYVATLFEPIAARRALPCFDEPRFKTPWRVTLHVRAEDSAFSNAPVDSEMEEAGGMKIVRFRETRPLPVYLITFAVGPWDVVDIGRAGTRKTPLRLIVPRGRAGDTAWARELTPKILNALETYFGIPFPFEKLDQVAIPATRGLAMEHAGLISYDQALLAIRKQDDSVNARRDSAVVMAHEMAHQWLGDLVTTTWWDDLWLNEAFAEWMNAKIADELFPAWNQRSEMAKEKARALQMDTLASARRIAQPIENNSDIMNAFDGITYFKGASVIRMFEAWLGPDVFRRGVQDYLRKYADGNATASDFLKTLSEAAGREISVPFSTFLTRAGAPLVSFDLKCDGAEKPALQLSQERFLPIGSTASRTQVWSLPVCFVYDSGGERFRQCTLLQEPQAEIPLEAARSCPSWVFGNDAASGYYRVRYSADLYGKALGQVEKLSDAEQIDFVTNAAGLLASGEIAPQALLDLALRFRGSQSFEVQQAASSAVIGMLSFVPPALYQSRARFLRTTYGPLARKLGFFPAANDSENVKQLRQLMLNLALNEGRDPALHAEAVRLARGWLKNRESLTPDLTGSVLSGAASSGDESLHESFLSALKKSTSRDERAYLMNAISSFRDATLASKTRSLVFDTSFEPIEAARFLFAQRMENGRQNWEFVKAHLSDLLVRLPSLGGTEFSMFLPYSARSLCSIQDADDVDRFLRPSMVKVEGGERTLTQVLETIRLCGQRRAKQEPDVTAFLASFRE